MQPGILCLTRKTAVGFILPLMLLSLSSCFSGSKDKQSAKEKSAAESQVFRDTTSLLQINVPGNAVYSAVLDDLDKANLQNVDLALKIFSNNKADSLGRDSMLVSFNEFLTSVMQEYFDNKLLANKELTDHFGNKEDQPEAQKLTASLASHGIQLNFREGEFYLEPNLGFVSERLGNVLTAASRDYLATRIKLVINRERSIPDSIANQVVAWEDFLTKYPGYVMKDEIRSQYLDALTAYLSGVEQFPLFDPDTKILESKYQSSYLKYMESYPNRESAKIVGKFYELLTLKGFKYDEAMDSFLSEQDLIPPTKPE
jgi:hypothetical protein